MSSYFSIKKTKKHLDIVNVYCHRHRSEQEFAAAGSICDDIITSNRRTRGGNILRDVLPSHFKREDTDGMHNANTLPGQEEEEEVLPPLDMLRLTIHDDGYKDVESLRRPFSLATPPKELLRLRYVMSEASRGERFIADVINRTFPTTREEEGGGRGSTDLDMVLNEGPAPDIKLLLQSLTVPSPPLRKIWIICLLIHRMMMIMMWKNETNSARTRK
ncbi:uncharacterized protein LOC135197538 [Macrobrachium nipponense]|uniref:uncharacterized protein LOC135197538 n=1 Tax=Macrobrachium nipponense TaxID=159736 RepID=UPI0030C7FFC7